MNKLIEMKIPASKHHYEKIESTKGAVWYRYAGFLDEHLAHGFLGDIYLLWTVAIGLLALSMVSTGVQLGYLSVLIPTCIEIIVIVVALVLLSYLIAKTDSSLKLIVRGSTNVSLKRLVQATTMRFNVNNDYSLFVLGATAMVVQMTLMIVFATSVTVSPNSDTTMPATVIHYNDGNADNLKNPIKPHADGSIDAIYLFVFFILVKSVFIAARFFDRTNASRLREKLAKLDAIRDSSSQPNPSDIEVTQDQRKQTAALAGTFIQS